MRLRIKQLRADKNLTLDQLADIAGLSHPYLSQIENGHRQPNLRRLEQIARALQVPLIALIDDESIPDDVWAHLALLRQLPPDDKQAVLRHAQSLSGSNTNVFSPIPQRDSEATKPPKAR